MTIQKEAFEENKTNLVESSLLTVISNSGGEDLIREAMELAIDKFLTDGILKDIPIVGTVANLFHIGIKTQGYIFTKKCKNFFFHYQKSHFKNVRLLKSASI